VPSKITKPYAQADPRLNHFNELHTSCQVTAVIFAHEHLKPVGPWTTVWATVAALAITSSRGTVFIALSLSSEFTAENEVAARIGRALRQQWRRMRALDLEAEEPTG
jgi:hypothetical protein